MHILKHYKKFICTFTLCHGLWAQATCLSVHIILTFILSIISFKTYYRDVTIIDFLARGPIWLVVPGASGQMRTALAPCCFSIIICKLCINWEYDSVHKNVQNVDKNYTNIWLSW